LPIKAGYIASGSGTDPANQKEIFYQIRRTYDIRSDLVHGELFKLKPKDGSVEEFIAKTGDYIQSAIFKFINLLADSKQIKNLDNEYWNSLMFK